MSEEAKTEAPKKKGKLPIIIVLALVLGGGGFFMMKGKGEKKAEPKIVLAEKETELEEFLTNTANPSMYVRAKLSVTLRKDFEEAKFTANVGDVRDAVIAVFNATSPADITDASKRAVLKKTLAEAMNTALEGPLEDKPKEEEEPKRKGKVEEKDTETKEDDWDSQTGPVLKVRFSALATQ